MTHMAKTKRKTSKKVQQKESDSAYFLKLVMYLIIGSQWLWFIDPRTGLGASFPIPIGFIAGIAFATHDHFEIDRKIEYGILLVAMFIGFWTRIGIFISV